VNLEHQFTIVEEDIEGFRQAHRMSGSDHWRRFSGALEKVWPVIKDKIYAQDIGVFGVSDILDEAEMDEDSFRDTFSVLNYLSGERARIIEMVFQFQDGDTFHELPFSTINKVHRTGAFQHPVTGEPIQDPKSKILMGYRLRGSDQAT